MKDSRVLVGLDPFRSVLTVEVLLECFWKSLKVHRGPVRLYVLGKYAKQRPIATIRTMVESNPNIGDRRFISSSPLTIVTWRVLEREAQLPAQRCPLVGCLL